MWSTPALPRKLLSQVLSELSFWLKKHKCFILRPSRTQVLPVLLFTASVYKRMK